MNQCMATFSVGENIHIRYYCYYFTHYFYCYYHYYYNYHYYSRCSISSSIVIFNKGLSKAYVQNLVCGWRTEGIDIGICTVQLATCTKCCLCYALHVNWLNTDVFYPDFRIHRTDFKGPVPPNTFTCKFQCSSRKI